MLPSLHNSQQYNIGGYIAIRNDATIQSIAERNLIRSTAGSSHNIRNDNLHMRIDGRKHNERRPISIQLIRNHRNDTLGRLSSTTTTATTSNSSSATTGSSSTSSSTVATVTFGSGTRVTCTVTSELVTPTLDRPNDGILSFTVDISPSANSRYRYATPASTAYNATSSSSTTATTNADRYQKVTANHIVRTLERCFVQPGGAIDTEALCVVPGAFVWNIHCTCTILDDAGNILDASILACIAAIRHYRQPVVELVSSSFSSTATKATESSSMPASSIPSNSAPITTTTTTTQPIIIPSHIKEPTPLPLLHTPITISFIFISPLSLSSSTGGRSGNSSGGQNHHPKRMAILIDPTEREELCSSGRITMGMNVYKEICFVDATTGYNCEIQLSDLQYCYNTIAESQQEHISTISQLLESALADADELDRNQRLLQLQQQLPLPPIVATSQEVTDLDENDRIVASTTQKMSKDEEEEEDIVYRRRALDYTIGHVASKVRENKPTNISNNDNNQIQQQQQQRRNNRETSSSNTLLATMLRSVNQQQQQQQQNLETKNADLAITTTDPIKETTTTILDDADAKNGIDNNVKPSLPPQRTTDNDIDGDEEEEDIMELQSEFVSVVAPIPTGKKSNTKRKRSKKKN